MIKCQPALFQKVLVSRENLMILAGWWSLKEQEELAANYSHLLSVRPRRRGVQVCTVSKEDV